MHVSTFYSFKGGVGRTMALVNTAVSMALRGRRVLVVDFDLEAPGLDTFDVLRPSEEVPGLVDFVAEYLETGEAPDVERFVGECPPVSDGRGGHTAGYFPRSFLSPVSDRRGGLWIMPAGRRETHAERFRGIDWGLLYERHDGFLLFEDLKAQWDAVLAPDYVLIDSRTGHTDTSGICTRQLPDSVVFLFFPNEQNLRGLAEMVREVRAEAEAPRNKRINLHFVMSNVPDLDDEDRILAEKVDAFRRELDLARAPLVVHRRESLSLLNQAVFAKDRPGSRLANEYGRIAKEIALRNPADRDGALDYLSRLTHGQDGQEWIEGESLLDRDRTLERIEEVHSEDGEVLFRLGELVEADGRIERAVSFIDRAIDAGYDRSEAYLKRARVRLNGGDASGAREDAWRVLGSEGVSASIARTAVLLVSGEASPDDVLASPAVRTLKAREKHGLAANDLNRSPGELSIAAALMESALGSFAGELEADYRLECRGSLGEAYVGLGRHAEAVEMFRLDGEDVSSRGVSWIFNGAVAAWGMTGEVDEAAFRRVVDLGYDEAKYHYANFLQCIAAACWAFGDREAALGHLAAGERAASGQQGALLFSCWHYLRVGVKTFRSDLAEMRDLIEAGETFRLPRLPGIGVSA